MVSHTTYGVVLVVFALCVVVYLAAVESFNHYIKRQHPLLWSDLGAPSLLNNSIANNWLLLKFFVSDRYRVLNDRKVAALTMWVRSLFLINSALFIAVAVMFSLGLR